MRGSKHSVYETSIQIQGLEKEVTILQISDNHLWELNEEDKQRVESKMALEDLNNRWSLRHTTKRFQSSMQIAKEIDADFVALTGDIFSFPSQKNLEILREQISQLECPYFFTLGNHDWHFSGIEAWNDQTRERNYPLFHEFTGGDPSFQTVDLDGIQMIGIDNSNSQVTPEQLVRFKEALHGGRTCVLFLHIPLYLPSLAADVMHRWKHPLMMNAPGWDKDVLKEKNMREADPSTKEFYRLVTEVNSEQIAAIFCGHLHFHHTDEFAPGRFQYVCHPGFENGYRIIRLQPAI